MRALLLILATILFAAHNFAIQQNPAAQQSQLAATGQDDAAKAAAAKAAERKKRFEEDKKRLEDANPSNQQAPPASSDQTLFVTPAVVNMMVGDMHSFSAFDIDGHTVTEKAEWSLSNSYVADLSGGEPTIVAKDHGTVTLRARIGGQTAEAAITVITGEKFTPGTILWSVPQIPGFKGSQIVQAVPSANGPDLYGIDKSDDGDTLIRALFSDGRQLWMKHYSVSGRPGTIKGSPTNFIAH